MLRDAFEQDPESVDLSSENVPDINVITSECYNLGSYTHVSSTYQRHHHGECNLYVQCKGYNDIYIIIKCLNLALCIVHNVYALVYAYNS